MNESRQRRSNIILHFLTLCAEMACSGDKNERNLCFFNVTPYLLFAPHSDNKCGQVISVLMLTKRFAFVPQSINACARASFCRFCTSMHLVSFYDVYYVCGPCLNFQIFILPLKHAEISLISNLA